MKQSEELKISIDYLTNNRSTLPKMKTPTLNEKQNDIQLKKCKSCSHYSFYNCKKGHNAAPEAEKKDCNDYKTIRNYL